ncbi:MAG: xanthine dehydrogenase accessory protein XdhC [Paracoccus sp. (in: a-proteobacteria)]
MLHSATLTDFLNRPGTVVQLCISKVRGSSPREVGATMFVRERAVHGTIGGGQMEHRAIETARAMLLGNDVAQQIGIALGPEIGQCCGGHVTIDVKRMSTKDKSDALAVARNAENALPAVYILGAGHVGRALADLFQYLPVRAILIDQRLNELTMSSASVEKRISAIPEFDIINAPPGSAYVVLTHDHALDFLLTSAALDRGDACYVGMIGSATKRARFQSWAREHCNGLSAEQLICPMGAGGSRDKRPAVIAAFVVAEVMTALTSQVTVHHPEPGTVPQTAVR